MIGSAHMQRAFSPLCSDVMCSVFWLEAATPSGSTSGRTAPALVSAGPGLNTGRALEMDFSRGGAPRQSAGQERIGLARLHCDCCLEGRQDNLIGDIDAKTSNNDTMNPW